MLQQFDKQDEVKNETYGKIKPLLTAEQRDKWDAMMSKTAKPKKKA